MARKRLPTVGVRDLGTSRLTPQVRRILKRRARGDARREAAPAIHAARQGVQAVNRGYREEKQSIRGATSMAQGTLAEALGSLPSSGLKGGARKQVAAELKSRSRDVSRSIPFLLADAASQRREDVTAARQDLINARAGRATDEATTFNQLLKEARGKGETEVKARRKDGKSELSDADKRRLRNASIAVKQELTEWAKDPGLRRANPLKSSADWRKFATGLDSEYAGFDLADAMDAIRRLRRGKKSLQPPKGGTRRVQPWEKAGRPFSAG